MLLSFLPLIKVVPILVVLIGGFVGVKALGHGVRKAASVRAQYELVSQINTENIAQHQTLAEVNAEVQSELEQYKSDDKKHRVHIDNLKEQLRERAAQVDNIGPCPAECTRVWSSGD